MWYLWVYNSACHVKLDWQHFDGCWGHAVVRTLVVQSFHGCTYHFWTADAQGGDVISKEATETGLISSTGYANWRPGTPSIDKYSSDQVRWQRSVMQCTCLFLSILIFNHQGDCDVSLWLVLQCQLICTTSDAFITDGSDVECTVCPNVLFLFLT